MKSEREINEEISLIQAQVKPAMSQHMSNEGSFNIVSKLRQVHPDIEKAIDALIEHSRLDGRVQGMLTVYHGKFSYMPSELAKASYEKVYGRSLKNEVEEIHQIGLEGAKTSLLGLGRVVSPEVARQLRGGSKKE